MTRQYFHSKRLLLDNSYRPGDVVVDSHGSSTSYITPSIKLKTGVYRIYLTGSGGWGGWRANSLSACGGGGGSGLQVGVDIYLKKGLYYYHAGHNYQNSRDGSYFTATYPPYSDNTTILAVQAGANATNQEPGGGGTGYIVNNPYGFVNIHLLAPGLAGTRGNSGAIGVGGAAVDENGFSGKGGDGTCTSGTTTNVNPGNPGHVYIQYLRETLYVPDQVVYFKQGGNTVEQFLATPGRYRVELTGGGGGQGGFATKSGVAFGSGGGGSGAAIQFIMKVNEDTMMEVYSGNVGSTNRGYVGSGGDGGDSFIREKNNPACYYACRSAGTGSGGWDGHGNGGYLQEGEGFAGKWFLGGAVFYSNGNAGTAGGVVGGWGTGGASVYGGHGAGAGGAQGNGTSGVVKVTYLGE